MMTPLKAIRAKCLDCSCGNPYEVTKCPITDCALYPYRDGHNPNRKGIGNKNPDSSKLFLKSSLEFDNESAVRGGEPL